MTIHYISGDLFENTVNAQAFAHGVNIDGVMGAGIALEFKKLYPAMYAHYKQLCLQKSLELGHVLYWDRDNPFVFNLITQTLKDGAKIEYVDSALRHTRQMCDEKHIKRLAMPRIGAGLGGLEWPDVKQLIEKHFQNYPNDIFVYEQYIPSR